MTATKLAPQVAQRITVDILKNNLCVGEVIGTSAELMARYGVGRSALREAIRLLEHQQVALARTGPGGGLVVSDPKIDPVLDAVAIYLEFIGASIGELFEARSITEELAAELAAERLDESGLAELHELRRGLSSGPADSSYDEWTLHMSIARLSRNPAIEFFVDLFRRLARLRLVDERLSSSDRADVSEQHDAILEAIARGNGGLARHRMHVHIREVGERLRRHQTGAALLPFGFVSDAITTHSKTAGRVVRQILDEVVMGGWTLGQLLGSEADLLDRYQVGRGVLREAVGILEFHHIVEMRQGGRGGLHVDAPDLGAVTQTAAAYLQRQRTKPWHLYELGGALDLHCAAGAARTATAQELATLHHLASRAEFGDLFEQLSAVGDLHEAIAGIGGSGMTLLMMRVVDRISESYLVDVPEPVLKNQTETGRTALIPVVAAITARDAELARLRMKRGLRLYAQLTDPDRGQEPRWLRDRST